MKPQSAVPAALGASVCPELTEVANGRLPWEHESPDWGRFDYRAWRESRDVRLMTMEARGLYLQFLILQWQDGFVPACEFSALRLLGTDNLNDDETVHDAWEVASSHFHPHPANPDCLINERQAMERWRAIDLRAAKVRGGREGGTRSTKKAPRRNPHKSATNKESSKESLSTPQSSSQAEAKLKLTELELDKELDRETDKQITTAADAAREVTPQVLVGAWVDLQTIRPAGPAIGKQGAAAKRICRDRSDEAIHLAIDGIAKLYPHSKGEPWDLMTLERKFDLSVQASTKAKSFDRPWLDDMLNDEGKV